MADTVALCREAWSAVKGDLRTDYDSLAESYRQMLAERAEKVVADRRVSNEGAGILQEFEQVLLELLIPERFHQPNPELPAEVKEELVAEAIEEPKPKKPRKAKK